MYVKPVNVICKSEEEFKRERHTPEKCGPRAVCGCDPARECREPPRECKELPRECREAPRDCKEPPRECRELPCEKEHHKCPECEEKPEHKHKKSLPFLKKQMEWGTEEFLLCGLILWQLLSEDRDYLLIGIFLFLLLFD